MVATLLLASVIAPVLPVAAGQLPPIPDLARRTGEFEAVVQEQIQKALQQLRGDPDSAEANGNLGMILHAHLLYELAEPLYVRAQLLAPAFGDVDNDVDIDIVIANNNGPARLLLNRIGSRNHWLGVRLQGEKGPHAETSHARVALIRKGKNRLWRRCHTDGSYLSAHDSRVFFGLGSSPDIKGVEVHWPGGPCETWTDVSPDQFVTLRRNSGQPCKSN